MKWRRSGWTKSDLGVSKTSRLLNLGWVKTYNLHQWIYINLPHSALNIPIITAILLWNFGSWGHQWSNSRTAGGWRNSMGGLMVAGGFQHMNFQPRLGNNRLKPNRFTNRFLFHYPLISQHNYGKSPCLRGKSSNEWSFSIAILVYQRISLLPFRSWPRFNRRTQILSIVLVLAGLALALPGMGRAISDIGMDGSFWGKAIGIDIVIIGY